MVDQATLKSQPGVIGTEYTAQQRAMVSRIAKSLHDRAMGVQLYYAAKSQADQTDYIQRFKDTVTSLTRGDEDGLGLSLDFTGGLAGHASDVVRNLNSVARLEAAVLWPALGHALGRYPVLRENFTPETAQYIADYATRRYHDLFAAHAAVAAGTITKQDAQAGNVAANAGNWFQSIINFCSAGLRYLIDWGTGKLGTRSFWKDYYEVRQVDSERKSEVEQVREVAFKLRQELQEMTVHGTQGEKLGAHVAQLITGVDHNGQFVSMPLFVDPSNRTLVGDIDKYRAKENPTATDLASDILARASKSDEAALKMVAASATALALTSVVATRTIVPPAKLVMGTLEGITRELGKGYTGALGGKRLAQGALEIDPRFREARGLLLQGSPDFERILQGAPHSARQTVAKELKAMGHSTDVLGGRLFRIGGWLGSSATKLAKVAGPIAIGVTAISYAHAEDRIIKADDLSDQEREQLLKIARIQSASEVFSIFSDPAMAAYKQWFVDEKLKDKLDKYIDKTIVESVVGASAYAGQYSQFELAAQNIERFASPTGYIENLHSGRNQTRQITREAVRQVAAIWQDHPEKTVEQLDAGLAPIARLIHARYQQVKAHAPNDSFKTYLQKLGEKTSTEAAVIAPLDGYNDQSRISAVPESAFYHDLHNQGMLYARYLRHAVESGQSLPQFEREVQASLAMMSGNYTVYNAPQNVNSRIALIRPGMFSSSGQAVVVPPSKDEIERHWKLNGRADQPGYVNELAGMMAIQLTDLHKVKFDYEAAHFETALYKKGRVPLSVARNALETNPKTGKPNNEPFVEWLKHYGVEDKFKSLLRAEEESQRGKTDASITSDSEADLMIKAFMYEAQQEGKWKTRVQQHRDSSLQVALDLHTKTHTILAAFMARPDALSNSFRLAYMMATIDETKVADFNTKLLISRSKDMVTRFEAVRQLDHSKGLTEAHIEFYRAFKAFGDATQQANAVTKVAEVPDVAKQRYASLRENEILAALEGIKQGAAPVVADSTSTSAPRPGDVFARVAEVRLGAAGVKHIEAQDAPQASSARLPAGAKVVGYDIVTAV